MSRASELLWEQEKSILRGVSFHVVDQALGKRGTCVSLHSLGYTLNIWELVESLTEFNRRKVTQRIPKHGKQAGCGGPCW